MGEKQFHIKFCSMFLSCFLDTVCTRQSSYFCQLQPQTKNDEKLLTRWANKIRESCDQQNPPPASTWGKPNIAQQSGLIYISKDCSFQLNSTHRVTEGGKIPECHWRHTNLTFHPKWSVMSLLNSYIFLLICDLSHIAPKMGWFSISIPDLQSVVIWHKTLESNLTMSNVPRKTWQVDPFETFRIIILGWLPSNKLSRALQEMRHVQGPKKALHSAPSRSFTAHSRETVQGGIDFDETLVVFAIDYTWWVMSSLYPGDTPLGFIIFALASIFLGII